MTIKSKFATAAWFFKRPTFWRHSIELVRRKFLSDRDGQDQRAAASAWAKERAVSVIDALEVIDLLHPGETVPGISPAIMSKAQERVRRSRVEMGGPGDLALIYAAARLIGSKRAVETGVAYGWSSVAILAALKENGGGRLTSVDMPYAKVGNEPFVGVAIPADLRELWTLIRLPDRNGLKRAIRNFAGKIDFAHYDSDKSYYGRSFAYPLIWDALVPGGVFISDDIQDNMRFAEFVAEKSVPFAVTESDGKYVGICRKP